jgi:hypothetical protein
MEHRHIAYFVTPHGYGHAARAAAVMSAVREKAPGIFFEIFTLVPEWFFQMSIPGGFGYHPLKTDTGLVQTTAMTEDLPATIHQLDAMLPFRDAFVASLAEQMRQLECSLVLCDIAPLGIAAAQAAGLASVLVENFTWDWIYEGYLDEEPRFAPHTAFLRDTFRSATWHILTQPACADDFPADLVTSVASRKPRLSRSETRLRLGVSPLARLVMVTMGGILTDYPFLPILENSPDTLFLIPGGSQKTERRGSLVLLPHHSDLYHPDLVGASDVVVGKLGYSTLAEAYAAGAPYVYIPRKHFRESPPMAVFARQVMGAVELAEEHFFNGSWLSLIPELLARGSNPPGGPNGADQAADFILQKMELAG